MKRGYTYKAGWILACVATYGHPLLWVLYGYQVPGGTWRFHVVYDQWFLMADMIGAVSVLFYLSWRFHNRRSPFYFPFYLCEAISSLSCIFYLAILLLRW